jgi:hypothetical protein
MTPRQIYAKYATDSVAYATFLNRVYRHIADSDSHGVSEIMYGSKRILIISDERQKEFAHLLKK